MVECSLAGAQGKSPVLFIPLSNISTSLCFIYFSAWPAGVLTKKYLLVAHS